MKTRKLFFAVLSVLSVFLFNSCEEETVDPCEGITCSGNGTPEEVAGICNCNCNTGYEGDLCENEERDKFEGAYDWTDQCSPGVNYTATIAEDTSDVTKVTITNILGTLEGTAVADVDGEDISIASQTVVDKDGDAWTVSSVGKGTINASHISFTITIQSTFGTNTLTCIYTYTKQ